MRRIRLTRSWGDPLGTQRAALWTAYFHRFFGPVLSDSDVPTNFRPPSCGESCEALYDLHLDPTHADTPSPAFLRECLPQMLYAGFRPRPERQHMLDALLRRMDGHYTLAATHDQDLALQNVLRQARQRYGAPADNPQWTVDGRPAVVAPDKITEHVLTRPTRVVYEGHVWTITTEFLMPCRLQAAAHLVNPENWTELGSFFKKTQRVDAPKKRTKVGAQPWSGRLHETFTLNWSMFTVQSFETMLKIDYTVATDVVRTDYSLEYEQDDQLIADDGYMEVRVVPKHPGWTHYTGQKSVRFASSALNLLAPAVICMAMDHDSARFQETVAQRASVEADRLKHERPRRPGRKDDPQKGRAGT